MKQKNNYLKTAFTIVCLLCAWQYNTNAQLLPASDNAEDLGSTTYQWRNLYLGGSVYLDGQKFIDNAGNCTFLGQTGNTANSGINNTFIGYGAAAANTSGGYNTFVGRYSGNTNTSGYANAFFGNASGAANTTGFYNSFIGQGAGSSNTTGYYNTFCGTNAAGGNTTGHDNSCFGNSSGNANLTGNNNAFFGSSSGVSTTASNNSFFGTACGAGNTTGYDNTFIGYIAGDKNTTGYHNIFCGSFAGIANTTGYYNTFIGYGSAHSLAGSRDNIFIGENAGYTLTSSIESILIGTECGYSGTEGQDNTCIGYKAARSMTTGQVNCVFGSYAASDGVLGSANAIFGSTAATDLTGSNNCIFGALGGSSSTSASSNVFIGYNAGSTNTTGDDNSCIGGGADVSSGTLTNATAVGNSTTVTSSNSMRFGNGSVTFWGFGANASPGKAVIVGTSSSNGNGAYLTFGGVWTDISDRNKKDNITQLDPNSFLEKINKLKVTQWKYKGTKDEYHIGPMAQDFHSLFEVGDDSSISSMDKTGVLFLGIQALSGESQELSLKVNKIELLNDSLVEINQELQSQLNSIVNRLYAMEQTLSQCCMNYQNQLSNPTANHNDISRLEQNIPNPFDANSVIKFYLSASAKNAQLIITDIAGHVIKQFNLDQLGFNQVTISGGELASGSYTYSLIIDGRKVDSKKMELTK